MTEPLVQQTQHHHNEDCGGALVGGKSAGHALVSAELSSSSLSAVDLCVSDIDWGTSAHTTSMDRSFNTIDSVSLESFPWADLSIFQDEEMDAKGIDLEALGTLPVDVDLRMTSGQAACVEGKAFAENTSSIGNAVKKKIGRKPRGPKPKYVFSSPEQAAAARKERNRAAALQSYYKKKNHTVNLELQVRKLEEEQNKLTILLEQVENGDVTIQSESDIEQHISNNQ